MSGEELKAALRAIGHNHRTFAAMTGVNERTIRRWFAGDQDIPLWAIVLVDLLRLQAAA